MPLWQFSAVPHDPIGIRADLAAASQVTRLASCHAQSDPQIRDMNGTRWQGPLGVYFRRIIGTAIVDPWPSEVDRAVRAAEAVPLCLNCLFPQDSHVWFCPHCGFPSGDMVPYMDYLNLFAIGEVLKRGVSGAPDRSAFLTVGFIVFSTMEYLPFAPIYWYWMLRKARGRPISSGRRRELAFEDDESPATGQSRS